MNEIVEVAYLDEQEWWDQIIEPACQRMLGMTGSEFMELAEAEREALNEKDHSGYIHVHMLSSSYEEWYKENIKEKQ